MTNIWSTALTLWKWPNWETIFYTDSTKTKISRVIMPDGNQLTWAEYNATYWVPDDVIQKQKALVERMIQANNNAFNNSQESKFKIFREKMIDSIKENDISWAKSAVDEIRKLKNDVDSEQFKKAENDFWTFISDKGTQLITQAQNAYNNGNFAMASSLMSEIDNKKIEIPQTIQWITPTRLNILRKLSQSPTDLKEKQSIFQKKQPIKTLLWQKYMPKESILPWVDNKIKKKTPNLMENIQNNNPNNQNIWEYAQNLFKN